MDDALVQLEKAAYVALGFSSWKDLFSRRP